MFYFDSSPIRLHVEGGVYDLYCSQPAGGDQRAAASLLKTWYTHTLTYVKHWNYWIVQLKI